MLNVSRRDLRSACQGGAALLEALISVLLGSLAVVGITAIESHCATRLRSLDARYRARAARQQWSLADLGVRDAGTPREDEETRCKMTRHSRHLLLRCERSDELPSAATAIREAIRHTAVTTVR